MKPIVRELIGFFLLLAICVNASAQPFDSNGPDGPTLAQQVYDRDDGKDSYATVFSTFNTFVKNISHAKPQSQQIKTI